MCLLLSHAALDTLDHELIHHVARLLILFEIEINRLVAANSNKNGWDRDWDRNKIWQITFSGTDSNLQVLGKNIDREDERRFDERKMSVLLTSEHPLTANSEQTAQEDIKGRKWDEKIN